VKPTYLITNNIFYYIFDEGWCLLLSVATCLQKIFECTSMVLTSAVMDSDTCTWNAVLFL